MNTRTFTFFMLAFAFFVSPLFADAATLKLVPESRTLLIGQSTEVYIVIDTEEESINAAQAIIEFPTSVFEVTNISQQGSVFNFWPEDPLISNEDGTVSFVGASSRGRSGAALHVLTLEVTARGSDTGELTFSDAVVTASDGRGTNVLSRTENTSIVVGTQSMTPVPPSPAPLPPQVPEEETQPPIEPQVVEREPVDLVGGLPASPQVNIPLYPNSDMWYSHIGRAIAMWDVPIGATAVATQLDENPNAEPMDILDELVSNQNLGILNEGVHYFHVQFRNELGWGGIAHYQVQLDRTPPQLVEANIEGIDTDNPTPTLTFSAQDEFSGISHVDILLNGRDVLRATSSSGTFTLSALPPGGHTASIRAFDVAGNSVEETFSFEVLPLPKPTISLFSPRTTEDVPGFVAGTSLPNTFVDITIMDEEGQTLHAESVRVSADGFWQFVLSNELEYGEYTFTARTRDERGAVSYPTEERIFEVRSPVLIAVGPLELGFVEVVVFAVLVILIIFGYTGWWYISENHIRHVHYGTFVRSLKKRTLRLETKIKKIADWHKNESTGASSSARRKLRSRITRVEKDVEELKKYTEKHSDDTK